MFSFIRIDSGRSSGIDLRTKCTRFPTGFHRSETLGGMKHLGECQGHSCVFYNAIFAMFSHAFVVLFVQDVPWLQLDWLVSYIIKLLFRRVILVTLLLVGYNKQDELIYYRCDFLQVYNIGQFQKISIPNHGRLPYFNPPMPSEIPKFITPPPIPSEFQTR